MVAEFDTYDISIYGMAIPFSVYYYTCLYAEYAVSIRGSARASAYFDQSVEGQRHPLDPPPPHSITGGGRANLTF